MSDKGLPVVNAKEVVKVLEKVGFKRTRQSGSHAVYKREGDHRRTIVPIHPRKSLKRKTLKSIINDAGLTAEEFKKLL